MPVDLPVRKSLGASAPLHRLLDTWGTVLAAICFTVALAELVSMTPPSYRAGLSAAVSEAMLQSP